MYERKLTVGVARLIAAIFLVASILAIGPFCAANAAQSAEATAPAGDGAVTPPKIHELLILLADPKVQEWLEGQGRIKAASGSVEETNKPLEDYLNSSAGAIREQFLGLARAIPDLPVQFAQAASRFDVEHGERGMTWALLYVAVFGALGVGMEWLCRKAMASVRRRLDGFPTETVRDRLRLIAVRFAVALGTVAVFALGSVGVFLALDLTPILRGIVLGYLIAFVAIRAAAAIGDLLLAPGQQRFRIIPTDTAAARFWVRRLTAFVAWFALGWLIVQECGVLGFSFEGRQLVAYALGFGLLVLALEAIWRRPAAPRAIEEAPPRSKPTVSAATSGYNAALSIGVVLLWVLWLAEPGTGRVRPGFWLVLVIMLLPPAILVAGRAVEHLLRPPEAHGTAEEPPSVVAICLERGVRALVIIGAVALLAWGWGVNLVVLAGTDTWFARTVHGALSVVVILLVTDVLWHALKAAIDRKLVDVDNRGQPSTDETRRQTRLRTLLPIFRNVLLVALVAVAGMMALAAMGVEIGPLIAGAGVVGVAVGFGAQTFVRDVIAGMFYLLDDAFRVGEYIQAGNYKGTVEGFSLRSVKLRHHRGPVYTVPFGLLGAVQNQSRDWVIDKMMVGVTYDSDLERARKLIKQIGLDLAKVPEFAPLIIEPLKMQGVEDFGDFAVHIRMKMMTVPGEQFAIRRRAYAMIKKAFDENDIKFAFPTVQIAGDGEPSVAAAAEHTLGLAKPAAA